MSSELVALSTGEEFKAAVLLWCVAWKQVPAGSLPNDDKILRAFAGHPRYWSRIREMALRGFIYCSDGRLYHRTLCDEVKRSWAVKQARDRKKEVKNAQNGGSDDVSVKNLDSNSVVSITERGGKPKEQQSGT